MYKLIIKVEDEKITYKPLSISLKYLVDEKKLEQSLLTLIKVSNSQISELQKKNFLSKEGSEIRIVNSKGKPDEMIISKVKINENFSSDYFRNHLSGLLPAISKEEVKYLHVFIPKYESFKNYFDDEKYFYQSFVEGVILGNYSFDNYKFKKVPSKNLAVIFYAENKKLLKTTLSTAQILMEGVNFTKDLQNEPSITLTPSELARRVRTGLSKAGVKITILDEKGIKKNKMGGLLAVGMGSDNPPRMIILQYKSSINAKKKLKTIALVGKGITFDSGGISIKPAQNMGEMKADMSGAAVVAGTILAAAKAKLPINLLGVIPSAENMVSGKSYRPGDIIITASGKSIEVDNTDAEGRIILADALDYASKSKPDVIIDLATLTGACVVALGEFAAGLFTKDDKLADELYKVGMKTFERVWRLPMWDDYNQLIKSDTADVKNIGGKWGGAITAAKFLEHFVDTKILWAHLDIAGPAMMNNLNNYTKKYMTGFGVRLLFEYLDDIT